VAWPVGERRGSLLAGALEQAYVLHLPPNIPAAIFWPVTVYDPITGSGLENGQPFPSLDALRVQMGLQGI
jgi:hypothetical protein